MTLRRNSTNRSSQHAVDPYTSSWEGTGRGASDPSPPLMEDNPDESQPPPSAQLDPLTLPGGARDEEDPETQPDADSSDEDPPDHVPRSRESDGGDSTSDASRPNRYRGPASTWRSWTEPERLLAASLDQQRASDLSLHLYCAHRLRARLRRTEAGVGVPSWASKERWEGELEREEGQEEEEAFRPGKQWTAWPLPPDMVPREGEEAVGWKQDPDVERWRVKRKDRHKPSHLLEELITAEVLKRARKRFEEREWEVEDDDAAPGLRPVIMADDAQASEILRPAVRHVLSKLDDTLQGLHKARSAYAWGTSASPGATTPEAETTTASASASASASRSASATASSKRAHSRAPRKRQAHDESASESEGESIEASSTPGFSLGRSTSRGSRTDRSAERSRSRSRGRSVHQTRLARLGLRDWSDVLGVASMTRGWDARVVQAAAGRCSVLFGEEMTFRALSEGDPLPLPEDAAGREVLVGGDEESDEMEERGEEDGEDEEEGEGGVHTDFYLVPIPRRRGWRGPTQASSSPTRLTKQKGTAKEKGRRRGKRKAEED